MDNEKSKNSTRFLLTFFLGWIGSLIINCTDLKPKGYKCRTLAYLFLTGFTLGIYGLVASISNLTFDPAKESNIGYVREEGYSFEQEGMQENSKTQPVKDIANCDNSLSSLIRKFVVLAMSIFNVFTLNFSLCREVSSGYSENGFTFMTFTSRLITAQENIWMIYFSGAFCLLFFLISIALIVFSIKNFAIKNVKVFNSKIIVTNLILAILYMALAIIMTETQKAQDSWDIFVFTYTTNAYVPVILQIILFVIYVSVGKYVKNIILKDGKSSVVNEVVNFPTIERKNVATQNDLDVLERFANLKEKGIITEEEFLEKKKEILT